MSEQPLRTLIVDDLPLNLKLLTTLLRAHKFAVSTAMSAEEAKTLLASEKFELLLLDIRLPGMDGLTFAKLLRADPTYEGMTIVAVTANAMKNDEALAVAAGCDGYVTKPIDTRRFIPYVTDLLAKRRPR
jgi:CheY-like chemotaxis protein